MRPIETTMGGPGEAFPETTWASVVTATDAGRTERLRRLCARYWRPVYRYVRGVSGKSVEDSKDLTQGFFCHVLEDGVVAKYDREKGRFRTFLKAALRNYLTDVHRGATALRRGGSETVVPLEGASLVPDEAGRTPEEAFDRQWASDVLERALARLQSELVSGGREKYWRAYQEYELRGAPYAEVARTLGLKETDVKNYLDLARERLRAVLLDELSDEVVSPSELLAEMRELFAS